MEAIQLMWASGTTACVLQVASEYSITDLGRMEDWDDCWLVLCGNSDGMRSYAGQPHKILNIAPSPLGYKTTSYNKIITEYLKWF